MLLVFTTLLLDLFLLDDLSNDLVDKHVSRHRVHGGHTHQTILVTNHIGIHHQLIERLGDVPDTIVTFNLSVHASDSRIVVGLRQFVLVLFEKHGSRFQRGLCSLDLVVLIGSNRLAQIVDGFGFIAFAKGEFSHSIIDAVAIVFVIRVAEHLVHHLVELFGVVGRTHLGHIHPRFEDHLILRIALDDLLELGGGTLRITLSHVNLSQDEHRTGTQIVVLIEKDAIFQVFYRIIIVLDGNEIVGNGEIEIAHQLLW